MGKLVRFNVGKGDFQSGFEVTLQIFEEGKPGPIAETEGRLPPAKEVTERYDSWRDSHRKNLKSRNSSRLEVDGYTDTTIVDKTEKAKEEFSVSFNKWLDLPNSDLSNILENIWQNLNEKEEIRFIVKTENFKLKKLPWYRWEKIFKKYRGAEVGIYLPVEKRRPATPREKVKVLAVFGKQESVGTNTRIDTEKDKKELEKLEDQYKVELIRLEQPTFEELCKQIDEQCPQIFFFAGHSSSEEDGTRGKIELNQDESIKINLLEDRLRNAVDRGLQLAIFNSCDGLGIAEQLADWGISNIIVMRESVPDQVAQKFLKVFLKEFAAGKSLFLAVRTAREKLDCLENKFPGAIWLPMLFMNPAEDPLTWRSLGGVEVQRESNQVAQPGEESEAEEQSSIVWLRTLLNNLSQGKQKIAAQMVNNLSKYKQQQRSRIGISNMMPRGILLYAIVVTLIPVLTELWLQDRIQRAVDATRKTEKLFTAEPSYQQRVFLCSSEFEGIPTTIAKTSRGFFPIIQWTSSLVPNTQKTCEDVSARFQKYYETDQLNYFTTATINGKAAICITKSSSNLCEGLLFHIPPGHNPEEVLKQLMDVRDFNAPPLRL